MMWVLDLKEIKCLPPQDVGAADGAEGPEEDSGSRSNNELERSRKRHFVSMWTKHLCPMCQHFHQAPDYHQQLCNDPSSELLESLWLEGRTSSDWKEHPSLFGIKGQMRNNTATEIKQRFCRHVLFSRFRSSRSGGGTVPDGTGSRRRLQGGNGVGRFGWGGCWRYVVCGRALEKRVNQKQIHTF